MGADPLYYNTTGNSSEDIAAAKKRLHGMGCTWARVEIRSAHTVCVLGYTQQVDDAEYLVVDHRTPVRGPEPAPETVSHMPPPPLPPR